MQLENNLSNDLHLSNSQTPHPNYKRIVIAITVFFIIALIGVFGYHYWVNKKLNQAEQVLMVQYQEYQANQLADFHATVNNKVTPATDTDKKEIQNMITSGTKQSRDGSSGAAMIESQQKQADQLFQEWKAAQ